MDTNNEEELKAPAPLPGTLVDRANQWKGWLEARMPGVSPGYREGLFLFALTEFGRECIDAHKHQPRSNGGGTVAQA